MPPLEKKIEEFKNRLEEILDENFPKGKCYERGPALVVFAHTVLLYKSLLIHLHEEDIEKMEGTKKKILTAPEIVKHWLENTGNNLKYYEASKMAQNYIGFNSALSSMIDYKKGLIKK